MEKKIFWLLVAVLSLVADFTLPFLWACVATVPIFILAWWIVYRSGWI